MAEKKVDVLGELVQRRTYYGSLRKEQIRANKFYELEFQAGLPKGHKQRLPATAREWVDVGVRNYTLDNPLVRMIPRGIKDKDREEDAKVETLANFFLELYIKQIKDACTKGLVRGETFFKVGMDDTYFGMPDTLKGDAKIAFEAKRLRSFPLTIEVIDPLNCYPSPAENKNIPVDMIESYFITIAEARNLADRNGWKWKPDKDKLNTDTIEWVSYISPTKKIFYLGEDKVYDKPNLFQFVPYYHVDAGMGQSSYNGDTKYLYRSILFPQYDALKMEARTFSYMDEILNRIAFRKTKVTGEDEEVLRLYPDGKIPTDPDTVMRAIDGRVDVDMMDEGNIPGSIFELAGMLASKASAPAALSGGRIPGVYSAQHREDIMATSLPLYKGTLKAVQKGLAVVVSMGLRIVDQIYKHDIQVRDITSKDSKVVKVGSSAINGFYDCTVQLLSEPPEATDMRKSLGSKLRAAGDISQKTNLTKYHNMTEQEARDEIMQIAAEQALAVLAEPMGMDALQQMGINQEMENVAEAMNTPPKQQPNPQNMGTGYDDATKRGRQTTQEGEVGQPGVIGGGAGEL